jgi:prepilin-type processing-associated H-X9-DG protein
VFADEHEQSIEDGAFYVCHANAGDNRDRNGRIWPVTSDCLSLPADRHNQGANLSFADGHVDSHHWKAPKTWHAYEWPATPGPDLQDLRYMQSIIPRLDW